MEEKTTFGYFKSGDLWALVDYLQKLSPVTCQRFAPHSFDAHAIAAFYAKPFEVLGYLSKTEDNQVIAYATVKLGFWEHDRPRLEAYGLQLHPLTDCIFAPSVADHWQGRGLGVKMFNFIQADLQNRGIRRVLLWGGVQQNNYPAVRFYTKMGFRTLGAFEHHGSNYDMVLSLEK